MIKDALSKDLRGTRGVSGSMPPKGGATKASSK